jgi:DNA-binding transcriptional LysR family regulator
MKNMNTEWLNAFVTFSQAASLEAAAISLKTTQPTLTRQLKGLEEALGVTLFSMQGRKKVLTQAGRDLLNEIRPRFEGLTDSVQRALLQQSSPEKVRIRIGGRREILARYAKDINFSGNLTFEFMGHQEIVRRLIERSLDIGITYELPDSLHIGATPIFADQFVVCAPKSWSLKKQSVQKTIEFLAEEKPALLYNELMSRARPILERLKISPASLKVSRTCADWDVLLTLISAGQGWAFLPENLIKPEHEVHIWQLPKELQISTQFYLIHLKELSHFAWFKEIKKTKW